MKYEIMFSIWMQLLKRDHLVARDLAEKYEISMRTVYRYIDALDSEELPIVRTRGNGGGFSLSSSFKLSCNYFTAEEYKALSECVLSVKSLAKTDSRLYEKISDKLASVAPRDREHVILTSETLLIDHCPWGDIDTSSAKIEFFEQAIANKNLVHIEYHSAHSEVSERDIEPHMLVLKQGMWYVYAFCREKKEFRLFKLSRIAKTMIHQKHFSRREIDREKLNFYINIDLPPVIDAEFTLDESIRTDVEEWLSIENVRKMPSGKLYASAKLQDNKELISKILSFQNKIKVVSPPSLCNKVLEEIKNIAAIYNA